MHVEARVKAIACDTRRGTGFGRALTHVRVDAGIPTRPDADPAVLQPAVYAIIDAQRPGERPVIVADAPIGRSRIGSARGGVQGVGRFAISARAIEQ
jgi:hypothetical protein